VSATGRVAADAAQRLLGIFDAARPYLRRPGAVRAEAALTGGVGRPVFDGMPAVARDRVNREILADGKARLTLERDRLLREGKANDAAVANRLKAVNEKLAGVRAIEERLAKPPSLAHPPAYLLSFSHEGTGRVIMSMGDPDTAAHVVTFVPGTLTRLGRQRIAINDADAIALSAAKAGSPSTAVISWADYRAPQSIFPEAMRTRWAEEAKGDLGRFLDDLRATHEGPPSHNTVVGYSYGSLVTGLTGRDVGLNVDDVVFVASPGVGVPHVGALRLTGVPAEDVGAHVHAVVSPYDPVGRVQMFGLQPTDRAFGGQTWVPHPAAPHQSWKARVADAHTSYFTSGNSTLVNIGRIAAGLPPF
jgi:hypothetical protein